MNLDAEIDAYIKERWAGLTYTTMMAWDGQKATVRVHDNVLHDGKFPVIATYDFAIVDGVVVIERQEKV